VVFESTWKVYFEPGFEADLAKTSELRHAVSSTFWAAALAHPERCSLCALEQEHALVLASAS
jgi:hypothetical protein